MSHKSDARVIEVAGALIGAVIGYGCVELLRPRGIHAVVVPAALPGIIAAIISKQRSMGWGLVYGVIGLIAALFSEWRFRPFIVDPSARYFLRHLADLQLNVKVVIGAGAVAGALNSVILARWQRPASGPPTV